MKQPFATDNKIGLPLEAPSTQTILPVICGGNGNIRGWLSIASTTFNGTETEYTTSDGPIPVSSVTLPTKLDNGLGYRVPQYMAAYFPDTEQSAQPWLGYSAFIDINESQYAARWVNATEGGSRLILNRGPLVTNLTVSMDTDAGTIPPLPPGPNVSNGTLRWAAAMTMNDLQQECGFIDFNWVQLFQAQSQNQPLRIEIVSNPVSGEFKTTIVPFPTVQMTGGVEFNTLRIIKLKPVTPGSYVFNYNVVDQANQKTPVVFTLTVV